MEYLLVLMIESGLQVWVGDEKSGVVWNSSCKTRAPRYLDLSLPSLPQIPSKSANLDQFIQRRADIRKAWRGIGSLFDYELDLPGEFTPAVW